MSQYFPEPYECSDGNVKVEFDLFNYAPKADLKGVTAIDTSRLSETDLTSMKTKLHNLDVDKLSTVPDDVSKLSKVVDNDVVEKNV